MRSDFDGSVSHFLLYMASFSAVDTASSNPVPTLPPARKWGILVILSLALAIIILDTTILNVALSAIIRDLKTDIQSLQWVITAYSLTLAALTITGGRMGDIFGRKRMFMVGAILFGVGSFLASISTNVPMLILGESLIEGIGAALMMPATASLLVANFVGRERAVAFGVWGGIAGASAALGPILGGYFTTHLTWRWGFRINLFVIFILLIGSVLIPESQDKQEKPELDWLGVFLSATGLLSFVFGIIEASRYGWWKAKAIFTVGDWSIIPPFDLSVVPFFLFIGAAILIGFLLWERVREMRQHTPLVSLSLFKNRQFSSGVVTTAIMSLGQTGLIFALPVFLQAVRGFDALQTGISLLPMSLALLIVSPLSAGLSKKIAPKILISTGLFLNVIAYLILHATLAIDTNRVDLIPGLALFGLGMGLVMSQINNLTLSAVSMQQAGEASGVNNTLRQVGSTLGSAIIGTILLSSLATNLQNEVAASTVIPVSMKPAIAQAMAAQSSAVEFGGGPQMNAQLPPAIQTELVEIGHRATVQGNRSSLMVGAIFAFLGFLASLFLPSKPKEKNVQGSVPAAAISSQKMMDVMPSADQGALDTRLIARLIRIDEERRAAGQPGIGAAVSHILDGIENGSIVVSMIEDERFRQARIWWEKGVGSALGMQTFDDYLQSIPVIPTELLEEKSNMPYLVLVDGRLSPMNLMPLLSILPMGTTDSHEQSQLQEKGGVYWMRCNAGENRRGLSVQEAESSFSSTESGLSLAEGLAFVAQYPTLIKNHYMDLTHAAHQGFDRSAGCLGVWSGRTELRWRWRDYADPRCGTASKRVV